MQTRRKKDLSKFDIKDLMLNEDNTCNTNINTLTKEQITNTQLFDGQEGISNGLVTFNDPTSNVNIELSTIEPKIQSKESNDMYSESESDSDDYNTVTWFLIDVEAYSLDRLPNIQEGGLSVIPVQIAWSICTYKLGNTSKIIHQEKKMFYVSEALLLSKYRNLLNTFSSFFTPATAQKHEQNMISSKFPVVPAKEILKEMEKDLKYCNFISAFNISWDLEAINNLCRIATSSNSETIIKNPMYMPKNLKKHIDLMVLSYKIFWNELHTNSNNSGSGIYTVANMHKILCENGEDESTQKKPQKQRHLAEYDLDMETDILSTILNKFHDADDFEEYVEKRKKNGNLTIPYWNKKKLI